MTPDEIVEGWVAKRGRIVLRALPNVDFPDGAPCGEERGRLLGSDAGVDEDDPSPEDVERARAEDRWIVLVDEADRNGPSDDGLRGGVLSHQIVWEEETDR